MIHVPSLDSKAKTWLAERGYRVISLAGKGRSSGVWKLKKGNRFFAAKVEHDKSFRTQMVEREIQMLPLMNKIGIGPTLRDADAEARLVVMDFVDGIPFAKWAAICESKSQMKKVLLNVFAQAKRMDAAGLDHGQLGGKLHNILVDSRGKITILDFEKASYVRKTRNVSKLRADVFRSHRPVVEKVRALLGENAEQLILG